MAKKKTPENKRGRRKAMPWYLGPGFLTIVVVGTCLIICRISQRRQKPRVVAVFPSKEIEQSCRGKYVVTPSFQNNQVIGDKDGGVIADKDPSVVMRKASAQGFRDPVIIFIPENDCICPGVLNLN